MLTVTRRDGTSVPFDEIRIEAAVRKAFCAVVPDGNDEGVRDVVRRVVASITGAIGIEEIQDRVETALMELGHYAEAKAYILYRDNRAGTREVAGLFMDIGNLVDDYIGENDWRVAENANTTYSLQGLRNYMGDTLSAKYWLRLLPAEAKQAHAAGTLHIHDLGSLSPYCCGWDLYALLSEGFGGVPGKVESRPPRHLRTALGQIVNFIYTLQGESAGAQAFSSFDTLLAPFVRSDGLDYAAVKQCLQEFVFNVNVPTRVGFQTPFSNLTLDVTAPAHYADQAAVVGGELMSYTYGVLQAEMDLINRALAEVLMEGDAHGRPFTFPIPTYNIWSGTDWDHERWQPIWEMAAAVGLPYFANFVGSDMKPEDVRSMCCRLRIDHRDMRKRLGGLFGSAPLTGSVGVVTLNLPRLAIQAEGSVERFFAGIDSAVRVAATALVAKRKVIDDLTEAGLYPYSKHYLRGVQAHSGSCSAQHFLTLGIMGAHEAGLELLGAGVDTAAGKALAQQVIEHMVRRAEELSDRHGFLFNVEATPGEGASVRLTRCDAQEYPGSVAARLAPAIYSGSTLLPADSSLSLVEALANQDALQGLYTGGTVFHILLGESLSDAGQAKKLIRYVCEAYSLPYVTLTPVFSICPVHGRLPGRHEECPRPGHDAVQACEVWDRIVGYFRPVSQWNAGKRAEFEKRRRYEMPGVEVIA